MSLISPVRPSKSPSRSPSLYHCNSISLQAQIMKLLTTQFSRASCQLWPSASRSRTPRVCVLPLRWCNNYETTVTQKYVTRLMLHQYNRQNIIWRALHITNQRTYSACFPCALYIWSEKLTRVAHFGWYRHSWEDIIKMECERMSTELTSQYRVQ